MGRIGPDLSPEETEDRSAVCWMLEYGTPYEVPPADPECGTPYDSPALSGATLIISLSTRGWSEFEGTAFLPFSGDPTLNSLRAWGSSLWDGGWSEFEATLFCCWAWSVREESYMPSTAGTKPAVSEAAICGWLDWALEAVPVPLCVPR